MDVPETVYQAIAEAKSKIDQGQDLPWGEEATFLKAYQQLAHLAMPVTAASLRDTDDLFGRPSGVRRLLRRPTVSHAKAVSLRFSIIAILAITAIIVFEFGDQIARGVIARQAEAVKLGEENNKIRSSRAPVDRQLLSLSVSGGQVDGGVLETLRRQREELDAREQELTQKLDNAIETALSGYRLLWRAFTSTPFESNSSLPLLIESLAASMSRFLLPLLYGLLGACAFILRSVIKEMHARSFEVKRFQDFGTRVYLGMLSGITVQWFFESGANRPTGGLTPAVLAFAGGYSVEMIFAAVDRVIHAATEALRPAATSAGSPAMPAMPGPTAQRTSTVIASVGPLSAQSAAPASTPRTVEPAAVLPVASGPHPG